MGDGSAVAVLVLDDRSAAEMLLAGRIGRGTGAVLDEALEPLLTDPQVQRIEIDVALVDSCDSDGLATFARARHQAAHFGVPLRLVRVGPLLHRTLEDAGLTHLER